VQRWSALAAAAAIAVAGCDDAAESAGPLGPTLATASVGVTSAADAGPGSLRAAVAAASADPVVTRIQLAPGLGTIALAQPIAYTGTQPLAIHGAGAAIDASGLPAGAEAALVADATAGIAIRDLAISGSPGAGLTVKVPSAATGTVTVDLDRVTIAGNAGHGVLINDQAEYFNDPNSTSSGGSAAGLVVRVTASTFEGNGFGDLDRDGLRVNEGGDGGIDFTALGSTFAANGADGIELDERAAGDAAFVLQQVEIQRNGPRDPDDLDDGLDVDESGDGSVIGRLVQVTASDNLEEGLDLNENGAGDLRVEMTEVEASRNGEEGVDLEEDDDFIGGGDLVVSLRAVTTTGNTGGDAGLKLRERGDGGILGRIVSPASTGNAEDGIQLREQDGGVVDAEIVSATASDNLANGVRLRGDGQVRIQSLTAACNGDDDILTDAGIVVTEVPALP